MSSAPPATAWSLEVVRGKDAGRLYALRGGEIVLGNALGGEPGIDLSDQEGSAPRRMAAKQAKLECSPQGVALRDLDSPGGTFVNRQRLLSGQARLLQPGDVIQLGGVQLRVVAGTRPTPVPPPLPLGEGRGEGRRDNGPDPHPSPLPKGEGTRSTPAKGPFAFALKSGPVCRSWDDFLTVSAQRWDELREELVSGRLAAYLASVGRTDHSPSAHAPGTPDERLDAWLAAIPTTKASQPELDVHPASLVIRAAPGGGTTRRKVRLANAGYRLLRATSRVEPPGTPWLAVAPEVAGRSIVTPEGADLPFDVAIPEQLPAPLAATLVIESNGGSRRVAVTLEAAKGPDEIPDAAPAAPIARDWGLRERIAAIPVRTRAIAAGIGAAGLRLGVGLIGGALGFSTVLAPAALVLATACAVAGVIVARRRGGTATDLPAAAFAGGVAGLLAALVFHAACRAIEPILGEWLGGSLIGVTLLWAVLAEGAVAASAWLVPEQARKKEAAV
jgi:hypothetical protein